MNNIKAYIEQHKDRFLNELIHLLRVPSISADPVYKQDLTIRVEIQIAETHPLNEIHLLEDLVHQEA